MAKTKEPEKRGRGRPRIHPLPTAKAKPRQAAKPSKTVKARASAPSPNGKTSLVFDFANMTPEQRGTITSFVIEQAIRPLVTPQERAAYLACVGNKVLSYFPFAVGESWQATAPGVYVEVKPVTTEPEIVPEEVGARLAEPIPTTAVDSNGQEHAAYVVPYNVASMTVPSCPEPLPAATDLSADLSPESRSDPTYAPPMPEHDIPESDPH